MKAYHKVSEMVYQLRDRLGDDDFLNYETHRAFVMELLTLRRLVKRHHKLAEFDCNGYGVIRGRMYYSGMSYGEKPDEYEIMEYGYGVKSAYLAPKCEETIFDVEQDKVQKKIEGICKRLGLSVEFQGDPRGYTVKIFKGDLFLDVETE